MMNTRASGGNFAAECSDVDPAHEDLLLMCASDGWIIAWYMSSSQNYGLFLDP